MLPATQHLLRLFEVGWRTHNVHVLLSAYAPDVVCYVPGLLTPLHGAPAVKAHLEQLMVAFPDAHFRLLDTVETDDAVALRWIVTGVHTGALGQLHPTGRLVTMRGANVSRLRRGKVVAEHIYWDTVALLRQLAV